MGIDWRQSISGGKVEEGKEGKEDEESHRCTPVVVMMMREGSGSSPCDVHSLYEEHEGKRLGQSGILVKVFKRRGAVLLFSP